MVWKSCFVFWNIYTWSYIIFYFFKRWFIMTLHLWERLHSYITFYIFCFSIFLYKILFFIFRFNISILPFRMYIYWVLWLLNYLKLSISCATELTKMTINLIDNGRYLNLSFVNFSDSPHVNDWSSPGQEFRDKRTLVWSDEPVLGGISVYK